IADRKQGDCSTSSALTEHQPRGSGAGGNLDLWTPLLIQRNYTTTWSRFFRLTGMSRSSVLLWTRHSRMTPGKRPLANDWPHLNSICGACGPQLPLLNPQTSKQPPPVSGLALTAL